MTVVEHRSPYKRIEIGSGPVREDSSPQELENSALKLERDVEDRRIWRLVEQSARGVNVPTEDRKGETT